MVRAPPLAVPLHAPPSFVRLTSPAEACRSPDPKFALSQGLAFSKVWERMFGKQEMRILMVGLDAAGKTTILYKLKLGEVVTTIPTIGTSLSPSNFPSPDPGREDLAICRV